MEYYTVTANPLISALLGWVGEEMEYSVKPADDDDNNDSSSSEEEEEPEETEGQTGGKKNKPTRVAKCVDTT